MKTLSYKTISAKKEDFDGKRKWFVVDADGVTLGRLSSRIASILRGKTNPAYTPHADTGDFVIVTNAEKVRLTGKKSLNKEYQTFSGYPGGQKIKTAKELLIKKPKYILEHAVKGMLPKNSLGRQMFKKLFLYTGAEHPHAAQKPETLTI
ncbi:MAG: 50S ribosomal protein L13 [Saprospiraceae bacterium]